MLVPAVLILSSLSSNHPAKHSPSRAAVDSASSQSSVASSSTSAATAHVSIPDAGAVDAVELLDLESNPANKFVPHRLRIVIDPGHGGKQIGAIGPTGLKEKDLVLDIALRLGERLRSRLRADIVYTRMNDGDVPLESRRLLANQLHADLFISVHANSSPDRRMRGVETYYMAAASSRHERIVASQENASPDRSFEVTEDGSASDSNVEQSRALASLVLEALYHDLSGTFRSLPNRGVKHAPFVVLRGAEMPSVLAEICFLSSPEDERKLAASDVRSQVAEALYRGVSEYVDMTQKPSEYRLSAFLERKVGGK
jgi:N-acetylmuramoyl-L-alanine amidase